jgi:hypothetical protein
MYRIIYMILSNSVAELEKFLQELSPKDLMSRQITFGLKVLQYFKSGNFLRIINYMVIVIRKVVNTTELLIWLKCSNMI